MFLCSQLFPFVAYPTCLAVQRFLVMSLCLCNTLHTLPSFYLFFGPSLVLHNPLSLSYSIILLPSSVQFPSFFSSLCFVLHFTSHESRCYFFFPVMHVQFFVSCFCFFTDFPTFASLLTFLLCFWFLFISCLVLYCCTFFLLTLFVARGYTFALTLFVSRGNTFALALTHIYACLSLISYSLLTLATACLLPN